MMTIFLIWAIGMIVIYVYAAIRFFIPSKQANRATYVMMFLLAWLWPFLIKNWISEKL